MFLLTAAKKGFSSKEIQRQFDLKRYEPVWSMVHQLKKTMGNRDDRYTLERIPKTSSPSVLFLVAVRFLIQRSTNRKSCKHSL
jgi:hypothetical protein